MKAMFAAAFLAVSVPAFAEPTWEMTSSDEYADNYTAYDDLPIGYDWFAAVWHKTIHKKPDQDQFRILRAINCRDNTSAIAYLEVLSEGEVSRTSPLKDNTMVFHPIKGERELGEAKQACQLFTGHSAR